MPDFKLKSITIFSGVFEDAYLSKAIAKKKGVFFVMEGRPSFDAAQKTSKVLLKSGQQVYVMADNMVGFLFFKGWVKEVVLACQTADSSGALCDSGALIVAVLAAKNKVPIKLVKAQHKTRFLGDPTTIAPKGINAYVPLVEWVPAKYLK